LATLGEPAPIPDPAPHDDKEAERQVGRLLARRDGWMEHEARQYQMGERLDLYLTQASGASRFHAGSPRGRELNRQLDRAEGEILSAEHDILMIRLAVSPRFETWESWYDGWIRKRAYLEAVLGSLVLAGVVVGIVYGLAALWPQAIRSVQSLLWVRPPGDYLLTPWIAGTLFVYLFLPYARKTGRTELRAKCRTGHWQDWHELAAKWNLATDVDLYFTPYGHFSPGRDRADDRARDRSDYDDEDDGDHQSGASNGSADTERWFEVLGVGANASVAEIKAAYRKAIAAYHSDKYASAGQKIRDLAEAESKRINAAYEEARRLHAFR